MRRHFVILLAIVLVAALFRAWLIASDGVSFDSDEAVVGLMARHITQGKPIPTFYYGQAYMGSLDALLIAGGFRLLGESIHTIRIVQAVLYLLSVGTGWLLAREVTHSRRIAGMTALLLAIPTPLAALYTTISLGGYNEIILLGNLILLWGWQVTQGQRREPWRWVALGLAAGVGWWVNGAIVTVCMVVGLLGLRASAWRKKRLIALAALAFLLGSAPWWLYNLRYDWAALNFLTEGFQPPPGVEPISPGDSLIGLLLLGLPAIYGLRFPWEAGFLTTLAVVPVLIIYLILITDLLASRDIRAVWWVWLVTGVFALTFTLSSFSDATGRYLMPLWVPATIGLAVGLDRLRRVGWAAAAIPLGLLLAFQAGVVIRAAQSDIGLQPQLVERLQTPARYDAQVLDFLESEGLTRGYAGYWTSFRLVFRSGERVILDTALPYKDKSPINDRYPPYRAVVAQAQRVAWITHNFPALDARIMQQLDQQNITVQTRDFGPYRVYYDFSRRTAPADLDLSDLTEAR